MRRFPSPVLQVFSCEKKGFLRLFYPFLKISLRKKPFFTFKNGITPKIPLVKTGYPNDIDRKSPFFSPILKSQVTEHKFPSIIPRLRAYTRAREPA